MIRVGSIEVHHALAAHRATRLPVRAVAGHWVRELGARSGLATFPGPRRNPGNVTRAYASRVCGHLEGGSATERHRFPVFCSVEGGVAEYAWWMNNIRWYREIATRAAGDWRTACTLIERSPWSSDHYGGTLDRTAAALVIPLVRATAPTTNLRADPSRHQAWVAQVPRGMLLAGVTTVRGERIGGEDRWYRVRYGRGDGRLVCIHYSVADPATV